MTIEADLGDDDTVRALHAVDTRRMPRRRSQSQKRGLILGTVGVLFGIGLLAGLSYLSSRGNVELSNLGDRHFEAGDTERLAARIARDREPLVFGDASPNGSRPIYLDHDGGTPDEGWIAVLALDDGCLLEWTGAGYQDCNGVAHPRSGEGLTRFRTFVEGDTVYVDLRTVVE